MSEKDLTGKSLEMEVADLYRQLRGVERVERDRRIGGNQIDVYVRRRTKDGSLRRIAVEVKDYDKSVPLEIVSTYAGKVNLMRDGGLIDGGAIVARKDFTPSARETAEVARLPLLTLADLKMLVKEEQQSSLRGLRRWGAVALILVLVVVLVYVFSGGAISESVSTIGASAQRQLERALWEWMELLLLPAALALGAWLLNRSARKRGIESQERQSQDLREIEALRAQSQWKLEREIEALRAERQQKLEQVRSREAAVQAYFDQTAGLIKDARGDLPPGSALQALARARTLTVLPRLDGERKGLLLRFLYESGLIGRDGAAEAQPKDPESAIVRLTGADLSGANLKGATLEGADLASTNLADANLVGAKLTRANLAGADLTRAILSEAQLEGADLSKANLSEADLGSADLSRANLEGAIVSWEQLSHASSFVGIILTGGGLQHAQLGMINLSEANLAGADLTGAVLWETQLDGADLSRANLSKADLGGADLSKAKLEGANLTGADLSRASLKGADLTGSSLEGAMVTHEQLDHASSLEGVILPDGTVYSPPKEPGTLNGDEGEPPDLPNVPVITLPE